MIFLASCSSVAVPSDESVDTPQNNNSQAQTGSTGVYQAFVPEVETDKSASTRLNSPEYIRGSEIFSYPKTTTNPTSAQEGENVSLNFVNTDLKDFLRSVLGQMLGLNYVLDPSVQGTVTLETTQPIKKDAVLPIVEETLRLNSLVLVRESELYKVIPAAGAPKRIGFFSAPGYKARIVPLHNVSVENMRQAIEALIPAGIILRADPVNNLFVLAGNDYEINNAVETISMFDVDSLSGLSFGLFPIKNTTAKKLGSELESVLSNTTVASMVKITPLERLNVLLISSKQHRYINEVGDWITRLDRAGNSAQQSLYVYRAQNGRAVDLVTTLNSVLLGSHANFDKTQTTDASEPVLDQDSSQQMTGQSEFSSDLPGWPNEGVPSLANGIMRITADEANNAVLILASPEGYRTVESALQELDVTPLQVLIEVAISEVTLNNELRYGVQYFFTEGQHSFSQINNSLGKLAPIFPGFNYVWSGSQNIQAALSLLESVTKVRMLASPQLLVLNNQQARIQVGDQVPVATQSATSTVTSTPQIVNSIEYKNTGINLSVTPRVNASGLVLLDISQEVSGVAPTTSSTLNSPTIQQRMVSSSIAVNNDETIALGGLIQESKTNSGSGIPVLQHIPVLGHLFGEDATSGNRKELLILITPRIVRNAQDSRRITEEVRSKLSALSAMGEAGK